MSTTTAPTPDSTRPSCAQGNFDCANCVRPLIALTPKGPWEKCDGKIYLCQFSTGSTTYEACTRFDIHKHACTHGGGTCKGCAIKWHKHILR